MNKKYLRKELAEITSTLINYKTVSPEGNEYLCTPYITKLMENIGMKTEIISKNDKRHNVLGTLGINGKSIVIACHMDTVPAGDGWKTEPFKAVVKNNRIYGRGAIDNKGPFAIAYCAIKKFANDFPEFNGRIYLVSLADEEADNQFGIKYLLKNGFKADYGLIPDAGYLNQVDIGEKGCVQMVIESKGKGGHSALNNPNEGAVVGLVSLLNKIINHEWKKKYDKNFTGVKTNISMINAGEYPNQIPSTARAQVDIRFPYGMSSEYILKEVQTLFKRHKGNFKLDVIYTTEPHIVRDKKFIKSFIKASDKAGVKVKSITLAGNSVAKEFNEAGIPSIGHYPMNELPIHVPNEYINISDMITTVEIYYNFLKEFFMV